MTRVFFGLLILLNIILYSKYESRHKRRHEGSMLALIRRLILSAGQPVWTHRETPQTRNR